MHKFLFYDKFIIFLYMFRALLCLSSGGQNCIIQHLVSPHSVGGRPVYNGRPVLCMKKGTFGMFPFLVVLEVYSTITTEELGQLSQCRDQATICITDESRFDCRQRHNCFSSKSCRLALGPTQPRFKRLKISLSTDVNLAILEADYFLTLR